MFRVVGDWDDGHGNIRPQQDKRSCTSSPLPGQPAKKKISLLDYKNKATGQSTARKSPPKASSEADSQDAANGSATLTEKLRSGDGDGEGLEQSELQSRKRQVAA